MKMKKQTLALTMSLALTLPMLAACGGQNGGGSSSNGSAGDVELTFMTNVVGEKANALEAALKGFEEETGYKVEFSAPGSSYEELMKTKMSSNEMPDVFTTHGWSVARYSDYLMPVNDMEFASRISDQIKPVITDSEGKMYVLPVDADIAGIIYNVDVLKAAGVDPDSIKTWDDFTAACETIKNSGVTPLHIGGKDTWTIGQFFDWVAPSFYVTDEANSKAEELKSGTFDSAIWCEVAQLMSDWTEAGYFNADVLTADYNSDMEALATGTAAFGFYGPSSMVDIYNKNADANVGMMPIPAAHEGDEPTLIAGEDVAVGIWKDTKYPEAAQELLEYLARPEVCAEISKAAGNSAGLSDVEVELGDIKTYFDKYKTVETFPYFDREYLPSGLWDVMCSTGAEILGQKPGAVENAGKIMEQAFNDKYAG